MSNQEQVLHPLAEVVVGSFSSWAEWQRAWDAELKSELPKYGNLMGLLHCAFALARSPNDDGTERISFMLSVADGWQNARQYFFQRDFIAAIVAEAWKVLCADYFSQRIGMLGAHLRLSEEPTMPIEFREPLFSKLLWFFTGGYGNVPPRNTKIHREILAFNFFESFAENAWRSSKLRLEPSGAVENLRGNHSATLVQLLAVTDQLEVMIAHSGMVSLDDMNALGDIAVRKDPKGGTRGYQFVSNSLACEEVSSPVWRAASTWWILYRMRFNNAVTPTLMYCG